MSEYRRMLVLKVGSTLPAIAARRGDFEQWISSRMGIAPERVQVVDIERGEEPPDPAEPAAVVVTGSAAMVTDRLPWSEHAARWVAEAVGRETPLLGICYGHQLIAHGLDGEVGVNPRGREIGTIEVALTSAGRRDPLLGSLGDQPRFQATHVESVLQLPSGSELLATSPLDPRQAFRLGERAWGVQFHPEFDAEVMRSYIEARRELLLAEGLDPAALAESARDTDHGSALLHRFAELFAS